MSNKQNPNIEELKKEIFHLQKTLEELKSNDVSSEIKDKEFRLLFEHLSSGFSYHEIIFDTNNKPVDCRYIEVNKAFEDILNFNREDIIGKTFLEIQSGEIEDFWMEIYGKISRTGITEKFEQYSQLLDKYLEITAYSPQYGKFVTIFNDVTLKKLNEKKLQIAKTKAEESDKLKTTFLENMSHEIRTPMNGIIGFAELLKDVDLQLEQKVEYISYINNSCNTLTKIIDDIIDISKIEAGQLQLFKNIFSLSQLMNEIHKQFTDERHKRNKSNIEIIYTPFNKQNILINTDQTRLTQIFYNLLSNALKFTSQGKIEFGYEIFNNESIRFFVKDTGIGIPKSKQKIIFERFRQVDESQHRSFGGAGLGLAISQNLVKLLGGNIRLESELKKGTSFYFEIPNIIENYKVQKTENNNNSKLPDWNDKKILIVEDDNINFILLKEILSKTNADIFWASDGHKAIEICSNIKLDLILMDILLPNMSGYDTFIEIRKTNKEIPVIAQTAQAMIEEKRKIEKAGFSAYIPKPIKTGVLFETISCFLENNHD